MASSDAILVQAGKRAYSLIKDNGLTSDMVKVLAGAAGGPKWIVLRHLDQRLFSDFFKGRQTPLHIVGASSGAWRFAAMACQNGGEVNPEAEAFQAGYIGQTYQSKPSPETVSGVCRGILESFLSETYIDALLSHPYARLNVMAVKSMGATANANKLIQGTGLSAAFLMNAVKRKWLGYHFKRVLFYDPRTPPPFFEMDEFPIIRVPLTRENLKDALMSSGSIPMVMAGVKKIKGAPDGVYRDGGMVDYHMDLPYLKNGDKDGIVLFTHFTDRVIPGWFDKKLPWRKPTPENMENVLLISPSETFLQRLPHGKIPDRDDFYGFEGRDAERIAYWEKTAEQSRVLGDAFMEAVESGKIREMVRPL